VRQHTVNVKNAYPAPFILPTVPNLLPHVRAYLPGPAELVRLPRDSEARRVIWGETPQHPAVMNVYLAAQIVELYTKPGGLVLDPFGGAGTTGAVSLLTGRNAVLTEIEDHWADVAREMLRRVWTSPPAPGLVHTPTVAPVRWRPVMDKSLLQQWTSPPSTTCVQARDQLSVDNSALHLCTGSPSTTCVQVPDPEGVDKPGGHLWTSPGASAVVHTLDAAQLTPSHVSGPIDLLLTSPPYLDTFGHPNSKGRAYTRDHARYNLARERSPHYFMHGLGGVFRAAVPLVRPGGVVVLVTKDPIREGERYPFALRCILLMQALGCELRDWWRRDCVPSHFQHLQRRASPDAPRVNVEDVLVFERTCLQGPRPC
jgi:DNA methylase